MQKTRISTLVLTSPAFGQDGKIPAKHTCVGRNVSPPLRIEGVPHAAKSLALIVDDPDAPGGIFTHWVLWNLDPERELIEEDSVPQKAVQGRNDFGNIGYGGPCPPFGEHRYQFHLYALDSHPLLTEGATREELERAFEDMVVLDQTTLVGRFAKPHS